MSGEFLRRAKKELLETADRTLHIGSVASVALAPYTPVFSPQEEVQGARDNGHTQVLDTPLGLNGIPRTLEAPDGRRVVFDNTEREQIQSQEVSVFGFVAGFNERGNLVLSTIDNKTREIVLPRVSGFVLGEVKFSPDGTKIAAWRKYSDGPPPAKYDLFLVDVQTSEATPFLPEFLENLGQFPTLLSFIWSPDGKKLAFAAGQHGGGKTMGVDVETGRVLFELRGSGFGEFSPDGQWFAKIDIGGKNLEVVNVNGPRLIVPNNGGPFSWSADSSFFSLS